jgi:hypothetical protein
MAALLLVLLAIAVWPFLVVFFNTLNRRGGRR